MRPRDKKELRWLQKSGDRNAKNQNNVIRKPLLGWTDYDWSPSPCPSA